jgi:hypothetical protein
MKTNFVLLALICSIAVSGTAGSYAQGASSPNKAADQTGVETPAPNAALSAAIKAYKAEPSDVSWGPVIDQLKIYLAETLPKSDAASILKINPDLSGIGTKLAIAGSASVWHWPQVPQSRQILVSWKDVKAQPPGRRGRVLPPIVTPRTQVLQLPQNVVLKDARVIDVPAIMPPLASLPGSKPMPTPPPAAGDKKKPEAGKFLVLAGNERSGKSMWLNAYKQTPDGWRENAEPLSLIPPFLLSHLTGVIAFSGNDLMLTVKPKPGTAGELDQTTYKLALRLVDGRYALEGKAVQDTPYNAVYQYVQAVNQGRLDLAKAWLLDLGPASIPKYVGLTNKAGSASPPRIINMSGGAPGIYRFRLVTFDKNDLVFEVSKPKLQWAIKGIFIAPSDPVLQRMAKAMPSLTSDAAAVAPSGDTAEPVKPAIAKPSVNK